MPSGVQAERKRSEGGSPEWGPEAGSLPGLHRLQVWAAARVPLGVPGGEAAVLPKGERRRQPPSGGTSLGHTPLPLRWVAPRGLHRQQGPSRGQEAGSTRGAPRRGCPLICTWCPQAGPRPQRPRGGGNRRALGGGNGLEEDDRGPSPVSRPLASHAGHDGFPLTR